ncbi:MAG TPA: hypothetical protein VFI45_02350 [Candidatus Acidoferrum sp.]|nr:hypothetical protein [Candidatus Acidoferrum sp.]
MDSRDIPVGSLAFWLAWKLSVILVLGVVLLIVFTSPDFRGPVKLVFLLIVVGIMAVSDDEFVYGRATESGIHFRRYIKMHFLPWSEIRSITWSASDRLQIRLKGGKLFRKMLSAQSFRSSSSSEWLSTPPEVVRWLLVAKPFGAEGIELIGPGL